MSLKPLQDTLVTAFSPVVGQALHAQRERDGVRVVTSIVLALRPQADGRVLVETRHSLYPVRVQPIVSA